MNVVVDEQEVPSSSSGKSPVVVGAIDQGTSSTRFVVFSAAGRIVASAQIEHQQFFPPNGRHEHDPLEIWSNTVACIQAVADALAQKGRPLVSDKKSSTNTKSLQLAAIGITNQRETTIAWNRDTGKPYYNAIVWDDLRTTKIAADIADGDKDRLRAQTGLPLASYFAGTKVKWLLDNVEQLRQDLDNPETRDQVCFGTVDAWLVYQLTGSPSPFGEAANMGGLFLTDVTNASRWLFMELTTQKWNQFLVDTVCAPHHIPIATALPQIRPSSEVYGHCHSECGVPFLDQVPVASILGDQHAALFGQTAFEPGQAKNTYGTGLFLMMNTGSKAIPSTHGLLTTVAYQIGPDVVYALEGSVSHSGSTIQWLRDQLHLIKSASESETVARTTPNNQGLYFVPAFAGLFAPHWRSDARACLVGMTTSHHAGHVCRAALEAAAYQAKEVFDAIVADSGVQLTSLKVDGGGTRNKLLMQFQADIIQVPVVQPVVMETTSIGAAFAAGLAVGVWKDMDEIRDLWAVDVTYNPQMSEEERIKNWNGWKKAVSKSLNWIEEDDNDDDDEFEDALSEPEWPVSTRFRLSTTTSIVLIAGAALCLGFAFGSSRRRSS